jgi:hypothetical protein
VADTPTLSSNDSADMASLPVIPAGMTCAQLARTTLVGGQRIQIVKYQTASASASSPQYCAVTGHINTYPELPAYKGYGNVSQALQKPVHWLGEFNAAMIWCNTQGTDCPTSALRRWGPEGT